MKFLSTLIMVMVMAIVTVTSAYADYLTGNPSDVWLKYDKKYDMWSGGNEELCRYHKRWGVDPDNKQYEEVEKIYERRSDDENVNFMVTPSSQLNHSLMKKLVNGETVLKQGNFVSAMSIKVDDIKVIGPRKILLIGEFGTYDKHSKLSKTFPCEIEVYLLNNTQKKYVLQQSGKLLSYVRGFVKEVSKDKIKFEYGIVDIEKHCVQVGNKTLFGN